MKTKVHASSPSRSRVKLAALVAICSLTQSLTGWAQVLIDANFKADFQTPDEGAIERSFGRSDGSSVTLWSWADGSDTGIWSVSKGYRFGPWGSTRTQLNWNASSDRYTYTNGYIADDANHSIMPHPNQGSHSLTLSWMADEDSIISISGALRKDTASASTGGVNYYLYHYSAETNTGTTLWSSGNITGATTTVIPTNGNTTDLFLQAGDSIMFVIASRSNNDTALDRLVYFSNDFAIRGHAIPEPSTYALIALGMGGVLFMRRRKKAHIREHSVKAMLSSGLIGCIALGAATGEAEAAEVKAGFMADFKTLASGEQGVWSDASGTGEWSVGFGNRLAPGKNFKVARFDPKIGGFHGAYGFSTRQFINDEARTIVPGVGAYSGSAIIRWTAQRDSVVSVHGRLSKAKAAGSEGDGIDCFLYQGERRLWMIKDLLEADTRQFEAKELAVKAGEAIYFVVSPITENNVHDAVYFEEDLSILGTSAD